MMCNRKILYSLQIFMILVAFLQTFGATYLASSESASYNLILTVQTERAYYGLGELVKIYGKLMDKSGVAVQGAEIAVEVKDPRNYTIFLDIVFSSFNGTYEDSFRLDRNAALGEYHVYATANAAGYLTAKNQTTFTVLTMASLYETSSSKSTLNESLLVHQTIMNGVTVSGDLKGTLNFTYFEMVAITTGPLAGKGFFKGEWEAILEGISYTGNCEGMLFLKPSERKNYLKGAISGEILGTVEGYISETVNGSGIYNRYQATWKIGRLHTTIVSATLYLNGTVVYQSFSEFPATKLYVLQTFIEGSARGHYNCSLSSTLTHVRILSNTSYSGEGFSIISYISNYGMGEGWTHDRLVSFGIVEMNGVLSDPLYGVVYATLNETASPRSLRIYIERVDLGLPPMPDLKVKIWGPERVSPGQSITYAIELRNDGLKTAENITASFEIPWGVDYLSNTGGGIYNKYSREVDWKLNLPAKSRVELTAQGKVVWGLGQGTVLEGFVKTFKEAEILTDPTSETHFEIIECNETYSKVRYSVSNKSATVSMDGKISITKISSLTSPTMEVKQIAEGLDEVVYSFVVKDSLMAISLIFPIDVGAMTKTADFVLSYKGYIEESKKFKANEELINDLYVNGYDGMKISEDAWKRLHMINEGEFILKTFIKGLAKIAPISGGAISKLSYDIPISSIASHYKYTVIAIDNLDLYFALMERYAYRNQVLAARDPNVKYGPEGYVSPGQKLNYTIEYKNEGEGIAFGVYITETLDENLDDSTLEIGPVISRASGSLIAGPGTYNPSTRTITWLVGEVGPGEGGLTYFTIKVRNDASQGTEIINFATVYFPSVPETTRTNTIVSVVGHPDIAITQLTPLETVIARGSILHLNLTIVNEGWLAETLNVTVYANSTIIGTENITMPGKSGDSLLLLWNTTDFSVGNYTISAYASPIIGETNTTDNLYVDGIVQIVPRAQITYQLTISETTGGTTNPSPGTYTYVDGTLVSVTAIPNSDFSFDHWLLNGEVRSENPITITMDKNYSLEAYFTKVVPPPLSVSIVPLSASTLVGESVTFTSQVSGGYPPYTYQWYLNGTAVSGATSSSWTFTPTTSGHYIVRLKVTDRLSNTANSNEATVIVAPPLTVSISPTSASILVGQSVTFTSTVTGGCPPYSYQWYLNGNPVSGAASDTWTFTPAASGVYYIYVRVIDVKNDAAQSGTAYISVTSAPVVAPIAAFTWSPRSPLEGETVVFDASASRPNSGEIVRFAWSFGDGGFGEGQLVTHTYSRSGLYKVTLTVFSSEGLSDSVSDYVFVRPKCFILTAVLGTDAEGDLNYLRLFRDKILRTNPVGEAFVAFYYEASPPIAEQLSRNQPLKVLTAILLVQPLIITVKILLSPYSIALYAALAFLFLYAAKKRKLKAILTFIQVSAITATIISLTALTLGLMAKSIPQTSIIASIMLPTIIPTAIITATIKTFKKQRK